MGRRSKRSTPIRLATVAALSGLAACGTPPPAPSPVQIGSETAAVQHVTRAAQRGTTMYVLNSGGTDPTMSVYENLGKKLLRNIDLGAATGTEDLAVDAQGDAFVSNGTALTVYGDLGAKKLRRLSQGEPFGSLTTDSLGNLYTQCGSLVCEYAKNSTKLVRSLHYPAAALATNRKNDVAVDPSMGTVSVFAPKAILPFWVIPYGSYNSPSLAFDKQGDLFVANDASADYIEEWSFGNQQPIRTITNDVTSPRQVLVDSRGYLYVLNGNGIVTVYAPGGTAPALVIQYLDNPVAMAIDASDRLYVANNGNRFADLGSIVIFKKGANKYETAITNGISNPVAVSVSSR